MPTVQDALRDAGRALARLPTPRLDAEILLGHVLGWTRAELIRDGERLLDDAAHAQFDALIAARTAGQPIAYLRGSQEFWSLDLQISDAVLVPRADTELLVSVTLMLSDAAAALTIADLGTGSGAIALALARELPRAFVLAIEYSASATAIAELNRQRLAASNMACVRGDWLTAVGARRCDFVVANPPYVADRDPVLAGPGLCFEPRVALVAGADGLQDLRAIARTAADALKPRGGLVLEHGASQGPAVRELLRRDFIDIMTARDLAGCERVTYGRRRA